MNLHGSKVVKKRNPLKRGLLSLSFFGPSFIIYSMFIVVPAILGFLYSFTSWNGISSRIRFVGLENYVELLDDKRFFHSVGNTLLITILQVLFFNVLGFLLAALMENVANRKIKQTLRAAYFFPYVMSYVVIGAIWTYMLNYQEGVINEILRRVGLGSLVREIIGDPKLVNLAIAGINIWAFVGFYIVVYMAAMQTVPASIYEASEIDGANRFTKLIYITFPLVSSAFTVCLVLSVSFGLSTFEPVMVLTQGGPGFSSETISYYIYWTGTLSARQGYATSISLLLFIVSLAVSVLQVRGLKGREVEY